MCASFHLFFIHFLPELLVGRFGRSCRDRWVGIECRAGDGAPPRVVIIGENKAVFRPRCLFMLFAAVPLPEQ
eukprot:SAG22_NODE_469_length_10143_cov_5.595181_5_plen_72_part_00